MLTTTLTKSMLGVGAVLTAGLLVAVGVGSHASFAGAPKGGGPLINTAVRSQRLEIRNESKTRVAQPEQDAKDLAEYRQELKRRADAKKLRSALDEPTEVEFIDTPLKDAMEFLADLHQISVIVDEAGLSQKGIKSDAAMTYTLSGITLQSALKMMLEPLGATYVVENGVIKVTAAEKVAANAKANGSLDLSERSAAEVKIENALTQPTQFEFIDTSLKDAMEFLADQHKITIILHESKLAEEGIAPDEPITHVLKEISFQSGLNIILEPLGLTYLIEDDVMKITTTKVEQQRKETRVYAVNALLTAGYDAASLQRVVIAQGEGNADIVGDAGVLVVTASQRSHGKILKLLEQLQRAVEVQGGE